MFGLLQQEGERLEPAIHSNLPLSAGATPIHAEFFGDAVDSIAESQARSLTGVVGGELVNTIHVGCVVFLVRTPIEDVVAALGAPAGGKKQPGKVRVLLPLCHVPILR